MFTCVFVFFFELYCNHRDLHVLTHSFPTRRSSDLVTADIIYVMDDGRIVEQGSHAELLAGGGHYARLYALQFAEQEDSGGRDSAESASDLAKGLRAPA